MPDLFMESDNIQNMQSRIYSKAGCIWLMRQSGY